MSDGDDDIFKNLTSDNLSKRSAAIQAWISMDETNFGSMTTTKLKAVVSALLDVSVLDATAWSGLFLLFVMLGQYLCVVF